MVIVCEKDEFNENKGFIRTHAMPLSIQLFSLIDSGWQEDKRQQGLFQIHHCLFQLFQCFFQRSTRTSNI